MSDIYNVVSYQPGAYHAFLIQDHYENWADHVSPPPDNYEHGKCWQTLGSAKEACEAHSRKHVPEPKTVKGAAEIKASFLVQAQEYKQAA
jgi:hypothetical protein